MDVVRKRRSLASPNRISFAFGTEYRAAKMARFDILFIVLITWCVGLVGALAYTLFTP
jgi:hypothetical protein